MSKGGFGETVVTLQGEPSQTDVQHLRHSLASMAGIRGTYYNNLTKKLIIRHDPNAIAPKEIVQTVSRIMNERRNAARTGQL